MVLPDPEVLKTNAGAARVEEQDRGHSTFKAPLDPTAESLPREAPTFIQQIRTENVGGVVTEPRANDGGIPVETHPVSANLISHTLNSTSGEPIPPGQHTLPGSIETPIASIFEHSAPASPDVSLKTPINEDANSTSSESQGVAASLISDIIEALGNNQGKWVEMATLTSPGAMPAELESIWSEDTSEVAPNAGKLRSASGTPHKVQLTNVIHYRHSY